MKKLAACVLSGLLLATSPSMYGQESSSESTELRSDYSDLGTASTVASGRAIDLSMLGWGLAIIVAITIVSLVLHSSTATAHS